MKSLSWSTVASVVPVKQGDQPRYRYNTTGPRLVSGSWQPVAAISEGAGGGRGSGRASWPRAARRPAVGRRGVGAAGSGAVGGRRGGGRQGGRQQGGGPAVGRPLISSTVHERTFHRSLTGAENMSEECLSVVSHSSGRLVELARDGPSSWAAFIFIGLSYGSTHSDVFFCIGRLP